MTIHKALYTKCVEKVNEYWYADIVVVDESTMVNGDLFLSLLKNIRSGAKLILLGDINQLTPIGNCQVFHDILESNIVPTSRLTKPHRQALESGIIATSYKVYKQERLFNSSFVGSMVTGEKQDLKFDILPYKAETIQSLLSEFKNMRLTYDNILDLQIITPMKTGNTGCTNINNIIQKEYNQNAKDNSLRCCKMNGYTLYIGDKVINTKNKYNVQLNSDNDDEVTKYVNVYNGNIGIVKDIEDGKLLIDFEGIGEVYIVGSDKLSIELAYVVTVHKTQGSEFKGVIIPINTNSYIMQNNELLYTAVTRAKERCVIIAPNGCIQNCIKNKETKIKQTFLKDMLISGTVC